jgi:hypothetical protein
MVESIRVAADEDDDEQAHGLEDDMREAVLRAIMDGAENAKDLAEIALSTNEIKFSRWCA